MVTKAKKEETVQELKAKFDKAEAVYAADQLGLTVSEIGELRKRLREVESEFKIAKNTLMKVATKGSDFEKMTEELKGPTALLFCYGDTTAPAGIVKKFSKEAANKIEFKVGVLDGELLDKDKVIAVSGLPSKDVLLSQIAGLLVGSISGTAYILQELGNNDDKDKLLKDFIVGEDKADAAAEQPAEAKAETAAVEAKVESEPKTEESKEEDK